MMSNEEFDRRMEFFLRRQAQFDADMAEIKATQAETAQIVKRTTENIVHIAGVVHEGFGLVANLFKDSDAKIKELTESQKLTDQKLRDLTAHMDRHLEEGHHGTAN